MQSASNLRLTRVQRHLDNMKQNLPVEHPVEKHRAEAAGASGPFDAAKYFPVGAGGAVLHG